MSIQRRPYPVEGTWERYRFEAGNILFLMLADRNDAPEPVGRGHSKDAKRGGYPAGAVTRETFNWWKQQVLANQDRIIVTMHHHALRDTTIASGFGEGTPRYHGSSGGADGSSYLYYIIENDDPRDFQYTADAHVFEDFRATSTNNITAVRLIFGWPGILMCMGTDDNWGDKTISETRWGVGFLQVAGLTRHHAGSHPLSRLLTFTNGSDHVDTDVYLHDDSFNNNPVGWYKPASCSFPLRHRCATPQPIERLEPFPGDRHGLQYPHHTRWKQAGRSQQTNRSRSSRNTTWLCRLARWNHPAG